MSSINTREALEYYLDRKVTSEEIQEADDWMAENPGVNLDEWVSAMIEIGAL
jgi:hypothetical protein